MSLDQPYMPVLLKIFVVLIITCINASWAKQQFCPKKKKSSPQIEHTGHNSRIQIARFSFLSKFWLAVPMHLRSDLENFGHTRAIYIIASGRRMTWKHVYLAASGVIREWGCCSPRTVTVKSGVLSTAPSSGATSPSSSGSWPPIMPVCLCGQELHGSRCGASTK